MGMINPVAAGELLTHPRTRGLHPELPQLSDGQVKTPLCVFRYMELSNINLLKMNLQKMSLFKKAPVQLFQFSSILETKKRGTKAIL